MNEKKLRRYLITAIAAGELGTDLGRFARGVAAGLAYALAEISGTGQDYKLPVEKYGQPDIVLAFYEIMVLFYEQEPEGRGVRKMREFLCGAEDNTELQELAKREAARRVLDLPGAKGGKDGKDA